jgi:GTP cyclohydrolase I
MKSDAELGLRVVEYLKSIGVATPTTQRVLTVNEQMEKIEFHFAEIMKALHLDLTDDSLHETPRRVAKMYVKEIFYGLNSDNFPKCSVFSNETKSGLIGKLSSTKEYVAVHNIDVKSTCEHHFLPIVNYRGGGCHIAYIPNKKVIGISKLARVARWVMAQPGLQERTNLALVEVLKFILETEDVGVVMNANHLCMMMRGVEESHSITSTCSMSGRFETDHEIRTEFLSACGNK